jgi:hypothetical protein
MKWLREAGERDVIEEAQREVVEPKLDPNAGEGTSLAGNFETSYAKLVAAFGEPNVEDDSYKVSSCWGFSMGKASFTIYDYKETDLYADDLPSVGEFRERPSYDWHIGANSTGKENIDTFINWLSKKVG